MDATGRELPLAIERTEEGSLRFVADAGGGHVFIDVLFERVMGRDGVASATLFAEVDPHATTALLVVFDVHCRDRSDSSKRKEHRRDHRPIAFAGDRGNVNRIEKLPGFFRCEDRRSSDRHDMLRPAHRGGGIHRKNLPRDEPVEEHLQRGEFLLHARAVDLRPKFFHVGSNKKRTDVAESDVPVLTPIAEVSHRPPVGFAGVPVADRDGEERDHPQTRVFTSIPKHFRKPVQSGNRNLTSRENEGVVIHAGGWEKVG